VEVVSRAAGSQHRDFVVARKDGDVAPESIAIRNCVCSLLGAEDAMDQDRGVRVGHIVTVMQTHVRIP
jgi:hypothetical protein